MPAKPLHPRSARVLRSTRALGSYEGLNRTNTGHWSVAMCARANPVVAGRFLHARPKSQYLCRTRTKLGRIEAGSGRILAKLGSKSGQTRPTWVGPAQPSVDQFKPISTNICQFWLSPVKFGPIVVDVDQNLASSVAAGTDHTWADLVRSSAVIGRTRGGFGPTLAIFGPRKALRHFRMKSGTELAEIGPRCWPDMTKIAPKSDKAWQTSADFDTGRLRPHLGRRNEHHSTARVEQRHT